MSKPILHAAASAKKWGGKPEDYVDIHDLLDSSKAAFPDMRHRAIYHNSLGCFLVERIFGHQRVNSDGRTYSPRDVAEQHIIEDMGRIPTLGDYLEGMPMYTWLGGPATKRYTVVRDTAAKTTQTEPAMQTEPATRPSQFRPSKLAEYDISQHKLIGRIQQVHAEGVMTIEVHAGDGSGASLPSTLSLTLSTRLLDSGPSMMGVVGLEVEIEHVVVHGNICVTRVVPCALQRGDVVARATPQPVKLKRDDDEQEARVILVAPNLLDPQYNNVTVSAGGVETTFMTLERWLKIGMQVYVRWAPHGPGSVSIRLAYAQAPETESEPANDMRASWSRNMRD